MKKIFLTVLLLVVTIVILSLVINNKESKMKITSEIFENNGRIPAEYTCNGGGTQPPLKISGVPESAKSLALIVDDPDAPSGDFIHWLVWNIAPHTTSIENGRVPGAVEGHTSLSKPGWVPPCPPLGTHRYYFKLYALDTELVIPASFGKADLLQAMTGHVLEQATLLGLYGKDVI